MRDHLTRNPFPALLLAATFLATGATAQQTRQTQPHEKLAPLAGLVGRWTAPLEPGPNVTPQVPQVARVERHYHWSDNGLMLLSETTYFDGSNRITQACGGSYYWSAGHGTLEFLEVSGVSGLDKGSLRVKGGQIEQTGQREYGKSMRSTTVLVCKPDEIRQHSASHHLEHPSTAETLKRKPLVFRRDKAHPEPEWWVRHRKELIAGTGTWVADNAEYRSTAEPYDAYSLHWRSNPGGKSVLGRMSAIRNDRDLGLLWEFRMAWDAVAGVVRVFQFGTDGTIGTGTLRNRGRNSYSFTVTFHGSDGSVRSSRDDAEFQDPEHHTTKSFHLEGRSWREQRGYTWKLQKK